MSVATCKICKSLMPSFEELKTHWRSEHMREYVAVQTWLSDVDEAVVVAECVIERQERGNKRLKELEVLPPRHPEYEDK